MAVQRAYRKSKNESMFPLGYGKSKEVLRYRQVTRFTPLRHLGSLLPDPAFSGVKGFTRKGGKAITILNTQASKPYPCLRPVY